MASIRNQIINKSCPIFLKNAYSGCSLSMILAKTGIVKGSLYHHFPEGKMGIALESPQWLLDTIWNPLLSELARARKSDVPNILYAFISNEVITNDSVIFPSFLCLGITKDTWKLRNSIEAFYLELNSKLTIVLKSKNIRTSKDEAKQFLMDVEILSIRYQVHKKRDSFLNPLLNVCKSLI